MLHNEPACKTVFKLNYKILVDNIDIVKLQDAFNDCKISLEKVVKNVNDNSLVEEYPRLYSDESELDSSEFVIYTNDEIYIIGDKYIAIYHHFNVNADDLFKNLIKHLPTCEDKPKETEIKLVALDQQYYNITSKIKACTIDIAKNYNDDFLPVYNDIVNFLNTRESGLVILHGEKGSGKTSMIRHFITNIPKQYTLIPNSIIHRLGSPEFMTYMVNNKDCVYILEDCEQVLIKREESQNSLSAISTILNMSDGLMSDIFNVKFICTFNADIKNIDEALLRKGRCFANYEFKPLCLEKTNALLNSLGYGKSNIPLTLANIYNYNAVDYSIESDKTKIGF